MVKKLNSVNFETEVFNSTKPVLVDFFATWCGPCKMLSPIIDELSSETIADRLSFAKLDIDESMDVAQHYGVMSVPTMILFANGRELTRIVGAQPKAALVSTLEDFI